MITIKLFGTLRSYYSGYKHTSGIELKIDSKTEVKQVIKQLGLSATQVGIVTIDGKIARADDFIPENSEVKVFQPLAGG